MLLNEAKTRFFDIVEKLSNDDKEQFFEWISKILKKDNYESKLQLTDEDILQSYAARIRDLVPVDATLESENIIFQNTGPDSDCKPKTTIHVDAFLYDDELMEYMIDEGIIKPHYCKDCFSSNIERKEFISHSLSIVQQCYIFKHLIPQFCSLEGKVILDLGSRMGAVIYGANILTNGKCRVIGIEMNHDWCDLQRLMIKDKEATLKRNDNGIIDIEVCEGNILDYRDVLLQADIIIMNNVFSFFNDVNEQKTLWTFVFKNLKKGSLLIHNPKLDSDFFSHLKLDFNYEDVIEPLNYKAVLKKFAAGDENKKADCDEIRIYRILSPLPV
uniref:Arsenite methyltransferase n=1 Tax=Parastrongyloides trichosuri TaxID=131310 RepID=A0A0N4ZRR6_PARTI